MASLWDLHSGTTPGPAEEDKDKPGLISSALKTGLGEFVSAAGSGVEAIGRGFAVRPVEQLGDAVSNAAQGFADRNRRSDLETAPWRDGGASTAPWLGYQALKQIPQLASFVLASRFVPESAVPSSLARVGTAAPKILGGGGMRAAAMAGASEAEIAAAEAAGATFGRRAIAAQAVGMPVAAGSMYQEAENAAKAEGREVSAGEAGRALALAPLYAGLDALDLNVLSGVSKIARGQGLKGLVKKVAMGSLVDGAMELPQEGLQTALEQSFRTDLTGQQKMQNIVDAALTGFAVGGTLGGAASFRPARGLQGHDPGEIDDNALDQVVSSALGLPAPPVTVDSGGRAAFGSGGLEELLGTPNEPRDSDAQVASHAPQSPLQIESQTIIGNKERPIPFERKRDYQQDAPAGPFSQADTEELHQAAQTMEAYLADKDPANFTERDRKVAERYDQVASELESRVQLAESNQPLYTTTAGVDERGADQSGGQVDTSAAPASAPFSIDNVLKGISTRKAYQGIASEEDLRAKLTERLAAGSAAKGDFNLAERLGINLNESGAPVADTTSATPEPDAGQPKGGDQTADAGFQTKWTEQLKQRRGTAIQQLRDNLAPNEDAAKRQVYDALGATTTEDTKVDGYKGLTELAQEMGLHDADGQLTEEGVRIARTAIPTDVTAQTALDAGYTGPDVSAFERGARGEKKVTLNSVTALKAYNDGRDWATNRAAKNAPIPAVAGDAATQEFVEGRTASEATGRTVTSAEIPQATKDAQQLNAMVDEVYGGKLDPAPLAQLKTLVRGGATAQELDDAARYIASGRGALISARPAKKPYTGEKVTRGLLNSKTVAARRQAASVERAIAEKRRGGFAGLTSTEQSEWVENKTRLRAEIGEAFDAGVISGKERIGLLFRLTRGDFQAIDDKLSNAQVDMPLIDANNPIRNRAQWGDVVRHQHGLITRINDIRGQLANLDRGARDEDRTAADVARQRLRDTQAELGQHREEWDSFLEQWDDVINGRVAETTALAGNVDGLQSAQMARNALLATVAVTAAAGVSTTINVGTVAAPKITVAVRSASFEQQVKVGSITGALKQIQMHSSNPAYKTIAARLARADWSNVRVNTLEDPYSTVLGLTTLEDDGSSRIDLFNKAGLTEETFLHEMIHAFIQQRWAGLGVYNAHNKQLLHDAIDRSDSTIEGFVDIWRQIGTALKATNPDLIEEQIWAEQVWADPDEMLAWVMTNAKAQEYLQTVDRDGKPVNRSRSLWAGFRNWVAGLFGGSYTPKIETALDAILDSSMSILDAGADIKGNDFTRRMAAGLKVQRELHESGVLEAAPMLVEMSNAQYMDVVAKVTEVADRAPVADVKGKVRETALGWSSLHGIGQFWGKMFDLKSDADGKIEGNGVLAYEEALNEKNAIAARLALFMTDARDAYGALQHQNRDSAQKLVQLMTASEFGINPTKPWREQSERIRDHRNAKNLERLHKDFHNTYRTLLGRGHADVYQKLRDVNDTLMLSTLAVSLHQQVDTDGHAKSRIPEYAEAPMDAFMREQALREFSAADARAWWMQRLRGQQAGLAKFLSTQSGVIASDPTNPSTEGLKTTVADLGKRLHGITETVRQMEDAPYFHLGRYGQFFVGWRVASSEALERIGEVLGKEGFDGVISDGTDKLKVYMRLESQVAQKRLTEVLEKLQGQGLVEPETLVFGKRTKESFPGGFAPQWANQMIANIEADSSLDADVKEMEINALRALSIDLMPETALARVMTHREGVPGYDPDMMRNFDWRGQVGINALAGAAAAPKITRAFVDMRGALKDAEKGLVGADVDQRAGMRDVVDELSRRERERAIWPETRVLDQLSSLSTAWFLGFSLSYGFVNMTQLGATLLPELGSKHGFVESSKAIARATPIAFRIMKEVAKHGYSISLDRAQDAVITQDVLKKVVGKETAEYLMRVVNTGNLDIGGPSRELARASEGRGDDKVDRVLRYASSIGYYTETMSRLITAIATRRLNPKMSVEQAAHEAAYNLNESMWNYSRTNQGRQFGKMGVFGTYTPLATKFLQFQAQLSEKLFREIYSAVKGETKAEQQQARRYLKGHLAAMTVLAGSLSLPAMTVLSVVFDRLKDLWDDDDEPSNIRADYRNWLAETLGPDAGEIVSHGGFRAFGFDISTRIGEQDIIPFSRFLADRRALKESIPDLATRTWGAPFSLVANVLKGGEKMMSGDIMGGLTRMLPNGLAGPVKAVRLYDQGYVDSTGRQVPVEPGPLDVLHQLFGLNPSRNAEYQEASNDQRSRRGLLTRDSTNLANQIIKAMEAGDNAEAKRLIERAQSFDATNPGYAILPHLPERISRRARQGAIARTTTTPLGVNPKDLGAMDRTAYANY